MGQFAHWVVVKGTVKAIRAAGLEPTAKSVARGWRYGEGEGVPDDLEALVARIASSAGAPAIGAWVADSDVAYIVAAAPGFDPVGVAVNDDAEEPLVTPPPGDADFDAFAAWSEAAAPRAVEAGELAELVRASRTFAEEGIFALLERLGLAPEYDEARPSTAGPAPTLEELGATRLAGYLRPLPNQWDQHHLGGRVYRPWRELRYLPGQGEGYIGVWDRERPDGPVERFPRSRRGEAEAHERVDELLMPVVLHEHRLDELGGYRATLLAFDQLNPGYRSIEPTDARFVFGSGDGFVGVWDRERPEGPIDRFDESLEGKHAAQQRTEALLFEWLAEGVRVDGLREAALAGGWVPGLLLVEEDPHPVWKPSLPVDDGNANLYLVDPDGGATHYGGGDAERVKRFAESYFDSPTWVPVPDEVPRTLAATLDWVASRLES
jgi:hypothetical protein